MVYGNRFLPKEEYSSLEVFESVCYNELMNKVSVYESCVDETQLPILEAQIDVLCEVTIKDIIEKIKELWEKFKAWVKKVWDSIFHNKKKADEHSDNIKKAVEKIFKDSFENEFSGKTKMNAAGALKDLKVPVYIMDKSDEELKDNLFVKCSFPGNVGKDGTSGLERRLKYIIDITKIRIFDDSNDFFYLNDALQKKVDDIKEKSEDLKEFNIQMLPIVDNKDNNVFLINNRLSHLGIKLDSSSEDNLRSVFNVYTQFAEGFKKDYIKIQGYKNSIDERIKSIDADVKKFLSEESASVKNAFKYNDDYKKSKEELNNFKDKSKGDFFNRGINKAYVYKVKNDSDGYSKRYTDSLDIAKQNNEDPDFTDFYNKDRESRYDVHKKYTKGLGNSKHLEIEDAKEKSEGAKILRQMITALQTTTNILSDISTKIIIGEQKNSHEMDKLGKIIIELTKKNEPKEDNEI